MGSLSILEAEVPNPGVSRGSSFWILGARICFLPLSWLLEASNHQLTDASCRSQPSSAYGTPPACLSVFFSVSYKNICCWFGGTPSSVRSSF